MTPRGSKNTTLLIGIIVVISVILGGAILFSSKQGSPPLPVPSDKTLPSGVDQQLPESSGEKSVPPDIPPETPPVTETPPANHTVTYSNSGFSPSVVTIQRGNTVTFTNNSSGQMWTASAIHPTHRVYPGTDIDQCGSAPTGTMFDACTGTSPRNSWPFTFQNAGTWKYHNHLNPGHTGTIIVE